MKPATPRSPQERREVFGLGFLFGTIYLVQGIGEPTEGLIAQPLRSLLKQTGYSAGEIATFGALLAIPWGLKPLYGLLTDFVPLGNSRRRSYLVLASLTATVGLTVLYLTRTETSSPQWLLWWLLLPVLGIAFSDVVVDALMIEHGQHYGLTGRFQSIQWACSYAAVILTGIVGGLLSQYGQQDLAFLLCAAATAVTLIMSLLFVRERRADRAPRVRDAWQALRRGGRWRQVVAVGAFLFLWSFNPFSNEVLYMHMTREMRFSEQFFGNMTAVLAVASVVASIAYGFYCRRVARRGLIHLSILLGILATLAYWGLQGRTSAVLVSFAVGFAYMSAVLIQLDLAAQVCPPEAGGTVFALLLALSNISLSLATWLGGHLYDHFAALWDSRTAFDLLVGSGAAATALCWLVVPWLRGED